MAEKRKLFNVEVLTFILGFDPKKREVTTQHIAFWLDVTPEYILDCDINQMFELCRKAQQIRGLTIEKEIEERCFNQAAKEAEENYNCENCKTRQAEENQKFVARIRDELQGSNTH